MAVLLGATYCEGAKEISFRIFSKYASRIEIYFYRLPQGAAEVLTKTLQKGADDVWLITICRADLIQAGIATDYIYYGYRAWGPNFVYHEGWHKGSEKGFLCDVDEEGNRFNPNKLLIDPYAREVSHDPAVAKVAMDPSSYLAPYYGGEYQHNRTQDTGEIAPKSIVLLDNKQRDYGVKPKRALKDDVIYEVNLRGLSMLAEDILQGERGTFKGAAQKAGYLKELGVTAVEFLPIQAFANEQNEDGDSRGDNYWGYMTLNYFAPNGRYSADKTPGGPTGEFVEMVKTFHEHGIKVFLDVVYNHTGEGLLRRIVEPSHCGTVEDIAANIRQNCLSRNDDTLQDVDAACLLSFAGLDNQSYYFLRDNNKRYEGRGSCGGNLNYDNKVVRNLMIDSLQYWVEKMGVDGFRFDLAPILSLTKIEGEYQANPATTIFAEISKALPARELNPARGVDLIAEPWGADSNQEWLAQFPPEWAVWNNKFRDTLKISFNKYGVSFVPFHEIATVLTGSKEFVGKKPWNSINYLVSHDDCNSLRSVFSYNEFFHLTEAVLRKDQLSWDQGGDLEAQKKAVRNAFTLLLLSPGVPMFAGGDELFRNIPAYATGIGKMNLVAVDSPEVYVNFGKYGELQDCLAQGDEEAAATLYQKNEDLYTFRFVQNLLAFRRKHECLRPTEYFTGAINPQNGFSDITWCKDNGSAITSAAWDESDLIAYRLNGEFEELENPEDRIISIYIAYNPSYKPRHIIFPQCAPGKGWYRMIDTDNSGGWMTEQGNFDRKGTLLGNNYMLQERSILVLIER